MGTQLTTLFSLPFCLCLLSPGIPIKFSSHLKNARVQEGGQGPPGVWDELQGRACPLGWRTAATSQRAAGTSSCARGGGRRSSSRTVSWRTGGTATRRNTSPLPISLWTVTTHVPSVCSSAALQHNWLLMLIKLFFFFVCVSHNKTQGGVWTDFRGEGGSGGQTRSRPQAALLWSDSHPRGQVPSEPRGRRVRLCSPCRSAFGFFYIWVCVQVEEKRVGVNNVDPSISSVLMEVGSLVLFDTVSFLDTTTRRSQSWLPGLWQCMKGPLEARLVLNFV